MPVGIHNSLSREDFSNQFVKRLHHRIKHTPIVPVQSDNGNIKLVRYQSSHLITPLVNDILTTWLAGTTCVLTKTNDEALQITGLLLKNGVQAKLIQSIEGFDLYHLLEVRYFLHQLHLVEGVYIISDEVWVNVKRKLIEKHRTSLNLELCINLIKDFELTNPKVKYKSDLEMFIHESKLEDFIGENHESIFVSTIHKAKGREFDNVFLMLDQFNPSTDEAKRQLYVGLTRVKRNLTIHYNGNYLNSIKPEELISSNDSKVYLPPTQLAIQLSFRDVWLDVFLSNQTLISQLNSGDYLTFDGECCRNTKGQSVIRFSKQITNRINNLMQNNYKPQIARVRYIVFWKKENTENEVKIALPELIFEKVDGT